jgi:hypothetical protein
MHVHLPIDLMDVAKTVGQWMEKPVELRDQYDGMLLRRAVERLEEYCFELDLLASYRMAERINGEIFRAIEAGQATVDLRGSANEFMRRIEDEISHNRFLSLSSKEASLWSAQMPFGEDVFERFPSAIVEIEEAGKCLAVERCTASVFHLMRAMEVALKATAGALGIPYAPGWEPYLKQIQGRIDVKWRKKGVQWRRDEPFFREVLAHLQAVRVAWRNPTMHVVKSYTREQAEDVYNAVRGFMRHLATGISEKPAGRLSRKKPTEHPGIGARNRCRGGIGASRPDEE